MSSAYDTPPRPAQQEKLVLAGGEVIDLESGGATPFPIDFIASRRRRPAPGPDGQRLRA